MAPGEDHSPQTKTNQMKIKVSDTAKLIAALEEGQGRAKARRVDVSDVLALATYAELELEKLELAKSFRAGATAYYFPPKVPNSYDYAAAGTFFTLQRGSADWYLVEVSRGTTGHVNYGAGATQQVRLSVDQQMYCVRTNPLFKDVRAVPLSAFDPSLLMEAYRNPKVLSNVSVIKKQEPTLGETMQKIQQEGSHVGDGLDAAREKLVETMAEQIKKEKQDER